MEMQVRTSMSSRPSANADSVSAFRSVCRQHQRQAISQSRWRESRSQAADAQRHSLRPADAAGITSPRPPAPFAAQTVQSMRKQMRAMSIEAVAHRSHVKKLETGRERLIVELLNSTHICEIGRSGVHTQSSDRPYTLFKRTRLTCVLARLSGAVLRCGTTHPGLEVTLALLGILGICITGNGSVTRKRRGAQEARFQNRTSAASAAFRLKRLQLTHARRQQLRVRKLRRKQFRHNF